MEKVHAAILLLGMLFAVCARSGEAQENRTVYTLGYLAPSEDSPIPTSLVIEWNSAFRVAMEVLNSENRSYLLVPYVQNSKCDWQASQLGAEAMVHPFLPPLIGIVGPACSGAAMSAARVFGPLKFPLVSFAATTEVLSDRKFYPNFFRTVYGDKHQAAAVVASFAKLNVTKATILTIQDYYSMNLATNIIQLVNASNTNTTIHLAGLQVGDNSTINSTQLAGILDNVQADELVILSVQPLPARDIWKAAYNMQKIGSPYWYFGTDGATAFDPADANITDPELVSALVGEIGVSPFGGNNITSPECDKFYSYWQTKNYPGLHPEGQNRSRSYVPFLIDAVQTFYEVIDTLIKNKFEVTAENVLLALNGSGPGVLQFQGCTGLVAFDPDTGSRSAAAQAPRFNLVSLTPNYWEPKGQIENQKFLSLQPLSKPGSDVAPNSTNIGPNPNSTSRKTTAGIVVGSLFAVAAVVALVGGGTYLYLRKKNKHITRTESMSRIMQ